MLHFFASNFIPHDVPQSFSASRSLWNWIWSWMDLMFLYTRQSSANKCTWVWGSTTDGRSLMNNRKSNGPMTVPWGTPERILAWLDVLPSTTTACVRSRKKPLIHCAISPSMPNILSLFSSLPWGTLSKAFAKSKIPTSVCNFTAYLRMRRSWIVRINWVSHEWYFLKPWLYGLRAPYLSRWDLRCEQMMCLRFFQGMHVKLTGL